MRCSSIIILFLMMLMMLSSFNQVTALDSSGIVEDALKKNVVIVVYFWDSECADCPTCENIIDDIDDFYGASIYIISLNLDNGETALVNLYDIETLPTVVIYDELDRYLTDEPYLIIEGLKTFAYYSSKINEALDYDDNLRASADTYFHNAEQYFNINDYENSKYYYEKAKAIYDSLGDVFNSITCSQKIIKCDRYISAHSFLTSADNYYNDENYVLAKEDYQSALTNYEYLTDEAMISYCNDQIQKCDLYPSLSSDYDDALLLMSADDYSSALALLEEVRSGYVFLGEMDLVTQIDTLISKCDDYILAIGYYSEATEALNDQSYSLAISKYQLSKVIYEEYNDTDKIALCDQNIAIAQQFLDYQTPVPTTPSQNDDSFAIKSEYIKYGGAALALILVFLVIFIYSRSGNKNARFESSSQEHYSALDKASKQFSKQEPAFENVKTDIESEPEPDMPVEQHIEDSFVTFQEKSINIKNSLLVNFVQWMDEFYDDLAAADSSDYFVYRERFDELYAFFSRSFSSDESYLDMELIDIAKARLQQIQSKLNDMMDVM